MSLSDLIGQTLGQYRIELPIDAGGMGQVYRGVHIYLNRPAAIKVMRPHLMANPSFRERFLQEARSAAALKHQNIVDIYEFGEQNGQLYLVMELVPDGSLRSLLHRRAQQPWPLTLGLDLMRQAAEGLTAAHAQNVVHRDIKPDNMLLLRVNGPDPNAPRYQLKISDFGLARLAQGSGLTATGVPMGTLAYMSPEQCLGGTVDGRTDLYALGVVLYEIATSYLPFQIESFEDALRKHTGATPTPPSQVRPDVPPALETIIMRCLAKKPEERYQSGADLARDLQGVLQSAEVRTVGASASSPSQFPRASGTVVRAPGSAPAPVVATLQGYSAQPRVRVLDQSGQTIEVAEITQQGITIGRQPGNAIVLPSDEISRQHVQVRWENGQVIITDLGSSNGTLLNDRRLQPNAGQIWPDRQLIRVGPFWLRLEGAPFDATVAQVAQVNTPPTGLADAAYTRQTPVPASFAGTSGGARIGVRVEPASLTITPGQPANARVSLTNLGVLVDWLTVTVEGVPPQWVGGPAGEVQLNPGMQETVDLGINVARSPENRAQDYPVVIRARSREKPGESGTAQARWTVLPFTENSLRVEPRRASGRGRAQYALAVTNHGNVPAEHLFSGEDDEQKIAYEFRQERLALEPGKEVRVPFTVAGQRRLFGKDQSQRFQIHSQVKGKTGLSSNAEFVNKALIPTWLLTVAGVLLALALVVGSLLALLLKPATPPTIITNNPPIMATAPTSVTPPPNSVPPMALTATPQPTATQPPMQGMTPPPAKPISVNVFIQQANADNTSNNFTVINATLTNKNPNAGIFVTQNITPNGKGQQFNPHETGVWFENTNWAIFNEDDMQLAQQSAFNVWIPKNANATIIQQATTANISGSGTVINDPQVNGNPNVILLVTQNWNPGGAGGVFDPHPVGVTYNNGSWVIFNEDGAAMPPQASFNVHVLMAGNSNFVLTADQTNMQNGATVIDNALVNRNPHAIILVTQLWNPGGGSGVYNSHPIGVAFDGQHWEIVNEDQTPIPQGASFNVVIVQH